MSNHNMAERLNAVEAKLRKKSKELLVNGEVGVVVGWGAGWNPMKASPVFVRDEAAADNLVFNAFCSNNLAVYLTRMTEKVAIAAKPCEVAAVIALIAEGKIEKDNVYIMGIPCTGMVDLAKVNEKVGPVDEATNAYVDGADLVIGFNGEDGTKRVPLVQVTRETCLSCKPDYSLVDIVIGEGELVSEERPQGASGQPNGSSVVPEDANAKWWREFWTKEFDRCLRCYACREACPACYCRDNCAVQALREKWTGATINPAEAMMFHAQRAMHVAGRCTECGACERACPVGIPLTLLHNQVGKAVRKLFDFNVGEKADLRPPLESFKKEEL
ncbi:MAG: 4Fe-4S dicluster domain-containing protein [Rubrobacteridae bacterium]|nr:4Fe-4S dicluster domain-containing protein [Rubrobacteridae bacterium]